MLKIKLTRDLRARWARSLKAFLEHEGHQVKHTTIVRAIANMLGLDEHSMAAKIKRGEIELLLDPDDVDLLSGRPLGRAEETITYCGRCGEPKPGCRCDRHEALHESIIDDLPTQD